MKNDAYVTLAALEHDWGHAWMSRDAGVCAELIGDDYVEIGANGRYLSKSEWIAALLKSPRQVHWLDLRVRPLGRCAVVHGRVRLLGASNGHDQRDTYIATDVWAFRGDRWQVISRHFTAAHAHTARNAENAVPNAWETSQLANLH